MAVELLGDWCWEDLESRPQEVIRSLPSDDARKACEALLKADQFAGATPMKWFCFMGDFLIHFLRWIKYADPRQGFFLHDFTWGGAFFLNANAGAQMRIVFAVYLRISLETLGDMIEEQLALLQAASGPKPQLSFPLPYWLVDIRPDTILEFTEVLVAEDGVILGSRRYPHEDADYDITVPEERRACVDLLEELKHKIMAEHCPSFYQKLVLPEGSEIHEMSLAKDRRRSPRLF